MKKWIAILLALTVLLGLAGCGAKSEEAAAPAAAAPQAAPSEMYAETEAVLMDSAVSDEMKAEETGSEGSTATNLPENQKLIRTVYMDAETLDMDPLMAWIESRVAGLGGYFEQKSIRRTGSRDDGSYFKYADLMIRIPAENLDQFLSQVGEEANVTSTSESTENVTLQYISTASRVQALETEQKRLLELLENAETMEDLLTIESRLTDVRWELENYASQLRVLDNQVNYSTLYLSIWEVEEPTIVTERTVWQKIGGGFTKNAGSLWNFLVNTFVWILTMIPFLVPLGLVGGGVILLCRKHKKKKESAREPKAE